MEWVELWVGHIRRIRITKKKKPNKEIKEEGEPTEKIHQPCKRPHAKVVYPNGEGFSIRSGSG